MNNLDDEHEFMFIQNPKGSKLYFGWNNIHLFMFRVIIYKGIVYFNLYIL